MNGDIVDDGIVQGHADEAANSKGARDGSEIEITQRGDSRKAQDLTSYALNFLSNASNETLGACFVGLGATTYLVLGRIGLVLIGVVGGVVLHATWDGDATDKGF